MHSKAAGISSTSGTARDYSHYCKPCSQPSTYSQYQLRNIRPPNMPPTVSNHQLTTTGFLISAAVANFLNLNAKLAGKSSRRSEVYRSTADIDTLQIAMPIALPVSLSMATTGPLEMTACFSPWPHDWCPHPHQATLP